jgi:hypothetical protein
MCLCLLESETERETERERVDFSLKGNRESERGKKKVKTEKREVYRKERYI